MGVIPAKGDYAARWLQKRVWMRHVKTEKLGGVEVGVKAVYKASIQVAMRSII
jgi:hypothetical protein